MTLLELTGVAFSQVTCGEVKLAYQNSECCGSTSDTEASCFTTSEHELAKSNFHAFSLPKGQDTEYGVDFFQLSKKEVPYWSVVSEQVTGEYIKEDMILHVYVPSVGDASKSYPWFPVRSDPNQVKFWGSAVDVEDFIFMQANNYGSPGKPRAYASVSNETEMTNLKAHLNQYRGHARQFENTPDGTTWSSDRLASGKFPIYIYQPGYGGSCMDGKMRLENMARKGIIGICTDAFPWTVRRVGATTPASSVIDGSSWPSSLYTNYTASEISMNRFTTFNPQRLDLASAYVAWNETKWATIYETYWANVRELLEGALGDHADYDSVVMQGDSLGWQLGWLLNDYVADPVTKHYNPGSRLFTLKGLVSGDGSNWRIDGDYAGASFVKADTARAFLGIEKLNVPALVWTREEGSSNYNKYLLQNMADGVGKDTIFMMIPGHSHVSRYAPDGHPGRDFGSIVGLLPLELNNFGYPSQLSSYDTYAKLSSKESFRMYEYSNVYMSYMFAKRHLVPGFPINNHQIVAYAYRNGFEADLAGISESYRTKAIEKISFGQGYAEIVPGKDASALEVHVSEDRFNTPGHIGLRVEKDHVTVPGLKVGSTVLTEAQVQALLNLLPSES